MCSAKSSLDREKKNQGRADVFYSNFSIHAPTRKIKGERNLQMEKGSLLAKVSKDGILGVRVSTPVADHGARATDDLTSVAFGVKLAQTNPLAKLLGVLNLEQVDLALLAECLNQTKEGGLIAVGGQNAQVGLTTVERLGALAQTTSNTINDNGLLQDFLEGVHQSWLLCLKEGKKNVTKKMFVESMEESGKPRLRRPPWGQLHLRSQTSLIAQSLSV